MSDEPGRILADRMVAMRDGVGLASDIYLPAGDGPFPTILTRMPYGKTEPFCHMPVIADYWCAKAMLPWSRTCGVSGHPKAPSNPT